MISLSGTMCVALFCDELLNPENGEVSVPSRLPGSTATYSCNDGFKLIGSSTRNCQSNGFWTGIIPLCQRKNYNYMISFLAHCSSYRCWSFVLLFVFFSFWLVLLFRIMVFCAFLFFFYFWLVFILQWNVFVTLKMGFNNSL